MIKTLTAFKVSLETQSPTADLSPQLTALWYDKNGDWQQAHMQVDHLNDRDSAWIHAYLHRKEGDIGNSDYWYHKAGKTRPASTLDEKWEELVQYLLQD